MDVLGWQQAGAVGGRRGEVARALCGCGCALCGEALRLGWEGCGALAALRSHAFQTLQAGAGWPEDATAAPVAAQRGCAVRQRTPVAGLLVLCVSLGRCGLMYVCCR